MLQSRYYSTKFEPPKKEERNKKLSDNIKKFLAKKEAEEKQKALEAHQKKEELLALRAKDKKATRRVNVMLKSTKSANKSVIQDAVDNDNTAVTLAGPSQPDEDDYGYVSQEASAYYNKIMEKYNNMPDEPKIFKDMKKKVNSNLTSTKDRVKAALLKEQEEAMMPHRRKRKSKHDDDHDDEPSGTNDRDDYRDDRSRDNDKPSKPKPKAGPPPINFNDLLKLAEKKQFEPIKIEPKKKPEDEEHPMTKRQKRALEEERISRERREERRKQIENGQLSNDAKSFNPSKIPKVNGQSSQKVSSESQKVPSKNVLRPEDRKSFEKSSSSSSSSKLRTELERAKDIKPKVSSSASSYNQNGLKEKSLKRPYDENKNIPKKESTSKMPPPPPKSFKDSSKSSDISQKSNKVYDKNGYDVKRSSLPSKETRPVEGKRSLDSKAKLPPSVKSRPFPPSDVKSKQFPPSDLKPKQFPPADLKPKQFPPADLRPKQFPPADVRRKPKKPLVANKSKLHSSDFQICCSNIAYKRAF